MEKDETFEQTALREVREESGVNASIIAYIGKSHYTFNSYSGIIDKDVHWYLMSADSFYSKPQKEEFFMDSGYYKYNEVYHLLKFVNERNILEQAYNKYHELKKDGEWPSVKNWR